jgi:hypothetical protein
MAITAIRSWMMVMGVIMARRTVKSIYLSFAIA